MTELEQLAKEAFQRYVLATTGKDGYWTHLNNDRKVAWMKEVIFLMDFLATSVHKKFKEVPPAQNNNVYAQGYYSGMATERTSMIELIQYLKNDLKKQLKEFEQQQKNLDQQD